MLNLGVTSPRSYSNKNWNILVVTEKFNQCFVFSCIGIPVCVCGNVLSPYSSHFMPKSPFRLAKTDLPLAQTLQTHVEMDYDRQYIIVRVSLLA